jgi:phage shock protein E
MQNYRKAIPFMFVLLVLFAVFVINPIMAGGGNEEAAEKAWPMIESGALVVDVRSAAEFESGHLDGAVNIEWTNIDGLVAAIGSDHQRPVVFYCRSGNRAGKSIVKLEKQGYTNIYNATGLDSLKATRP